MTLREIEQELLSIADDESSWSLENRVRDLARRIGLESVREELAHEQQVLAALECGE